MEMFIDRNEKGEMLQLSYNIKNNKGLWNISIKEKKFISVLSIMIFEIQINCMIQMKDTIISINHKKKLYFLNCSLFHSQA